MKSSITCKVNIGIVTFSKLYRNDAAVVMQKKLYRFHTDLNFASL